MDDPTDDHPQSKELRERAERIIPVGTQTFSKAASYRVGDDAPFFLERGEGSHIYDVDGHEYVDYVMALGPITVGYADERVNTAVQEQLENGVLLSQPHPKEVELSERLCDIIPAAEMVRFGKNGSDATSAAVRLARAYTGRERVAKCGYHGWQDWSIADTENDRGIPECLGPLTQSWEYNDLESLKQLFEEYDDIAAVTMEPMDADKPEAEFLEGVKDIAHDNGALLIFDEVITGFRFSMGGAQKYFGVTPDLAAFGKGIANGFPLSALVGRSDIMRELEDVFFSFTYGGELASLAAAEATIDVLEEGSVIDHMWDLGGTLSEETNELIERHDLADHIEMTGLDPWPILEFEGGENDPDDYDLALKSLFQREVVADGVLFNGNHFFCDSHTEADVQTTLSVYDNAFERVSTAVHSGDVYKALDGERIQPIFRRDQATEESES
jgi:glutamate-1-semialdehyde aminotransferase